MKIDTAKNKTQSKPKSSRVGIGSSALFSVPEHLSPRLAWMKNHRVKTHEFTETRDDPNTFNHVGFSRWLAFSPRMPHHENDFKTSWAGGETEDEAIVNLATRKGWKLWNEEPAATQPLNARPLNDEAR